jgi:NitT/TauT family transport system permease protein
VSETKQSPFALWLGRLVVGVVVLGFWELTSGRWYNDFWVSRPSAIVARVGLMFVNGDLWFHLQATLEETIAGLLLGIIAGTILGVGLASSGRLAGWVHPYVMAVYSLPKVALAPLFVVWFGIGLPSKIVMVTSLVIFVAFYNAYEGVRNIDPDLLDMMKTYKARRLPTLEWVILPSIAVWFFTSLRLGIGPRNRLLHHEIRKFARYHGHLCRTLYHHARGARARSDRRGDRTPRSPLPLIVSHPERNLR